MGHEKAMNMDQRDERIWRMKKEGATFSQIAERFDISPGRAQQIYRQREDKIENDEKWPPLRKKLPVRIQNVLIKVFGNEEIFKNPEKLASMGADVFITWQNIGRKSVNQLNDALQSLGYPANQDKMTDSRCQIYLKIGRSILQRYLDYSTKKTIDDSEYIPTVRVIIEGITEEMRSCGMGRPNGDELAEKLRTFNRQMYQNVWIKHAREDEEQFDLEKELQAAQYYFDYIYEHGKHPR
jgi:hypothetical protein